MARILTLTNWFPPHHFGGYEVLCDDVMSRLQARGHQVEVLCADELLPNVTEVAALPFPVHRQLKMYWRNGMPWTPATRNQIAIERANQATLAAALERFDPDVVSVWHMGALSLNLLTTIARRSVPLVYAICDEWLIYGLDLDPWSRRWHRNPVRRGAGKVIERVTGVPTVVADLGSSGHFCFLSEFTMTSSIAASPWNYPQASVIYPGIDRNRFSAASRSDSRAWSWDLLYTGRLDARKGTDTLLRAMPLLPSQATVSFLGRGEPSERMRLEALATELGVSDRVRFESVERSQLANAYASHDCLISPSEWPEPFGMVPLEAMSCGTPVVATGVGGSAEYLTDENNCLLFSPGDAADLARAITRMAEDVELRLVLCQNGQITAERFDVERTTDEYERCHLAAARIDSGHAPMPGPVLSRTSVPRGPSVDRVHAALRATRSMPQDVIPELAKLVPAPGILLTATGVMSGDGASGFVLLRASDRTNHESTIGERMGDRVLADPMHLPLRDAAFAGVISEGVLESARDDHAVVVELGRVVEPGGVVVMAAENRRSAAHWRRKIEYAWRGWRRSPASRQRGSGYTWAELEQLVSTDFRDASRLSIGWEQSRSQRFASRFLVGPLRRLSRLVVVSARPR